MKGSILFRGGREREREGERERRWIWKKGRDREGKEGWREWIEGKIERNRNGKIKTEF